MLPGLLSPEAVQLIDGQYADRPHHQQGPADRMLRLIRGSKLKLAGVDPALVAEAMRPGSRPVARIHLTDTRERPDIVWSVDHA
jgi:hypothetical protein